MKTISIKITLLLSIILLSCGSKQLSKDEAKSIINQCQKKSGKEIFKTNKYTYGIIDIPDSSSANLSNFLDKHKKMEELGFVSINNTKKDKREFGKSKNGMVEISLTPKGKDYLVGRVENLFGKLSAQFKSCEYKIQEIIEIQEIPDRNEAKVKVDFERYNETPFFEESNEKGNPKNLIKTITFRKTTDGWKLCD